MLMEDLQATVVQVLAKVKNDPKCRRSNFITAIVDTVWCKLQLTSRGM